jgi:hypothetical protein
MRQAVAVADSLPDEVLLEVGRTTVAASRLDLALTRLWNTLDRTTKGRRVRGGKGVRARVRRLACERLTGHLLDELLEAMDTAEDLARNGNALLHQDWAVADPAGSPPSGPAGPHDPDGLVRWHSLPPVTDGEEGGAGDVVPALRRLEARLTELTGRLDDLTNAVARARDLGDPPDWDGPAPRGRRLRATYAVTPGSGAAGDGGHEAWVHQVVLTLPETGQRYARIRLDDNDSDDPLDTRPGGAELPVDVLEDSRPVWAGARRRTQREWSGWYRLLPWAPPLAGAPVDTDVLDQALRRAGWHRIMPWTVGTDTSVSTTVERISGAGVSRS